MFGAGLLTSLGPCSISLLPVTVAYLAGFKSNQNPFIRSITFSSGIVSALVLLGSLSSLVGRIYGQVPDLIPTIVAVLTLFMGLNLLGIITLPLPEGPDPKIWQQKVPAPIAPLAAGMAFGLAASPCTTPVLAVLLGWISQTPNPIQAFLLLTCFGIGQVLPLLIAGSFAAVIPRILALKPIGSFIPKISGALFIATGTLSLLGRLI